MSRQISRNRWVNGNKRLSYWPHNSEFAGGHEMGTAIELGAFTMTDKGKHVNHSSGHPRRVEVYNTNQKQGVIDSFLEDGTL